MLKCREVIWEKIKEYHIERMLDQLRTLNLSGNPNHEYEYKVFSFATWPDYNVGRQESLYLKSR